MDRKQMQPTPAGRVSQQAKAQKGGGGMRKYVWSTIDAAGMLVPYAILKCSEEVAEEIDSRKGDQKWMFIAEVLSEKYPEEIPKWWDGYGRRSIFWYGNVLESYERAYKRMVEERMKALRDNFDNEESLRFEAEWQVEEKLASLPVFVIGDNSQTTETYRVEEVKA